MGGGDANATTDNATTTTTAGGGVVSPTTSEVRDNIELACIALRIGDTEGAMTSLDMALIALGGDGGTQGGNMTTSTPSGITDGTTTDGGSGAGGTTLG
jgi:hypothetical protein